MGGLDCGRDTMNCRTQVLLAPGSSVRRVCCPQPYSAPRLQDGSKSLTSVVRNTLLELRERCYPPWLF